MRITQAEKEKLREKILHEALPYLKTWGSGGAPVDKIMKRAGLTSGALYSHFKSKDDLFLQVLLRAFDQMIAHYGKQITEMGGKAALESFFETYLSQPHVKSADRGCIFVALSPDMHRMKAAEKALLEEKIETLTNLLASALPHGDEQQKLEKMRFLYSSLVGTLTMARAVKNESTAAAFLHASKHQLLKLLKT